MGLPYPAPTSTRRIALPRSSPAVRLPGSAARGGTTLDKPTVRGRFPGATRLADTERSPVELESPGLPLPCRDMAVMSAGAWRCFRRGRLRAPVRAYRRVGRTSNKNRITPRGDPGRRTLVEEVTVSPRMADSREPMVSPPTSRARSNADGVSFRMAAGRVGYELQFGVAQLSQPLAVGTAWEVSISTYLSRGTRLLDLDAERHPPPSYTRNRLSATSRRRGRSTRIERPEHAKALRPPAARTASGISRNSLRNMIPTTRTAPCRTCRS